MFEFQVTQAEMSAIQRNFVDLRRYFFNAVREGMREAMVNLAFAAAEAAPKRSGRLQTAIAVSAQTKDAVRETPSQIVGAVSSDVGRRHIGLWLEYGIRDPEVTMRQGAFMTAVFEGKFKSFTHHRAFIIPGHPFMNPTLQREKPMIVETLRRHLQNAVVVQQIFAGGTQ